MSAAVESLPKQKRQRIELAELFRRYGTVAIFVVLVLGATYESNAFLTQRNLLNVLRQVAPTGIMAIGMLFVILTRGIDLSVGSLLALGSVTCAIFVTGEHGTALPGSGPGRPGQRGTGLVAAARRRRWAGARSATSANIRHATPSTPHAAP